MNFRKYELPLPLSPLHGPRQHPGPSQASALLFHLLQSAGTSEGMDPPLRQQDSLSPGLKEWAQMSGLPRTSGLLFRAAVVEVVCSGGPPARRPGARRPRAPRSGCRRGRCCCSYFGWMGLAPCPTNFAPRWGVPRYVARAVHPSPPALKIRCLLECEVIAGRIRRVVTSHHEVDVL